ncbi:hypothetical protein ACUHGC_04780 [Testudinibacter sp. P27/CKL/0425]
MKPTIKTTALAVLISLGVAACGSSGGSSTQKTTTNNTATTTTDQSADQIAAVQKAAAEKAKTAQDAANKKVTDSQTKITKLTQDLAATDQSKKAEVEKLQQQLAAEKQRLADAQKAAAELSLQDAKNATVALQKQLEATQSAVAAANKKIADSQNKITKLTQDLAAADQSKKAEIAKLEKQLANEKALLKKEKATAVELQNQLTKFKAENPTVGYAADWRIRVSNVPREARSTLIDGTLDYLLQPGASEEERLRKFLFAPATSGILNQPRDNQWNDYMVNNTIDGKRVNMTYSTYRYSEEDAYLAELQASGTIDGKEINPTSIVLYGGNATPADKFTELQKLDAKKTYSVKVAPGLNRWHDSYDIALTADFGKAVISGKAVKMDNNPFTAPGDLIFPENPIYTKDGIIQFGGDNYVDVEFTGVNGGYKGEDQLNYLGMMVGAEAEKIVGRIGGNTMIGHEKNNPF